MRTLVVTREYPWPPAGGGRLRVAHLLGPLTDLGSVDLFVAGSGQKHRPPPPPGIDRVGTAAPAPDKLAPRLRWVASRLPRAIDAKDYTALRSAFSAWARPPYDLAYYRPTAAFVALGDLVGAPAIVDMDDLHDRAATVREVLRGQGHGGGAGARAALAGAARRLVKAQDLARWERLQHDVAGRAGAVLVTSDGDRARLVAGGADAERVVVVPNGYGEPARPAGRLEVGEPPVLTMVGTMSYQPNIDAARLLVDEILPHVRAELPAAEVRLVGRRGEGLARLAATPGVTVTGEVDDVGGELARADVIVVPLRSGTGTRIKVLEAFAHRIPVVATTVGCEGIDCLPDRHLLVADRPAEFAAACVRLLTDTGLRERITGAAHDLFAERYRWEQVTPALRRLARALTGP